MITHHAPERELLALVDGIRQRAKLQRYGRAWIAFLLGMIVMFLTMGVLPYWRLLLYLWHGCAA